jgi:hypothetical protein
MERGGLRTLSGAMLRKIAAMDGAFAVIRPVRFHAPSRVCLRRKSSACLAGNTQKNQRGFFPVTTGFPLYDTHSVNDPS